MDKLEMTSTRFSRAKALYLSEMLCEKKRKLINDYLPELVSVIKKEYDKSLPTKIIEAHKKHPSYFTPVTLNYGADGYFGHNQKSPYMQPKFSVSLRLRRGYNSVGMHSDFITDVIKEMAETYFKMIKEYNSNMKELAEYIYTLKTTKNVFEALPEAEMCIVFRRKLNLPMKPVDNLLKFIRE